MKSTVIPATSLPLLPFLPDILGFSGGLDGKESACNAGDLGWEDPLEEEMNPLQYSCLENSMDRRLAGYSPWGLKESDTTERLTLTGYPRLEIKVLNYSTLYSTVQQCTQNPVTCRGYMGHTTKYPQTRELTYTIGHVNAGSHL